MGAQGNKSNLSRRRSSAHTSKDQDKDKKCESEKVENDSKSRRKGAKEKVLCSSEEAKQDFDSKTSICSSKDSVQRNTRVKNESSKNKDKNEKKGSNTKVIGSHMKIVKGSCYDTRTSKTCKKGNERTGKKISGKESEQGESKRKTTVESPKPLVGSSARMKRKPYRNNECDFSKIETMIFEDHIDKEFPDKRTASERGKRKESKHSDVITKINRPKEIPKTGRKSSKISSKVSQKCKDKSVDKGIKSKKSGNIKKKPGRRRTSDSDGSDWEEVDKPREVTEMEALLGNSQEDNLLPNKSVKIELDAPDVLLWGMKKRKKRKTQKEMIEECLRKHLNRSIKEIHENMHKTHLLCLFAHGQYVNKTLNSEILLGSALSLITDKNVYPPKRLDMSYLEKFVSWFSRKIKVKIQDLENDYWSSPLEIMMVKRFENKTAFSNRELVYMFVVMSRALGMNVRLILSLQPMSWKPSTEALIKRLKKEEESSKCSSDALSCSKSGTSYEAESKGRVEEKKTIKKSRKILASDSNVEVQAKKKSPCKGILSESKSSKTKSKRSSSLSDANDSDFDPFPIVKKGPKVISKKRKSSESTEDKKRKLNGNNDDKEGKKMKKEPLIEWAEVYVEEEEKWICVDIIKSKIHCISEIKARTPSSSAYITAYNANFNVKDVTRRYITSWLSDENKVRCCSRWWQKTLQPFRGERSLKDKEEDDEMDQNLCQQPLPTSIGEYKNHQLYALQRHFLKFEAIYPPDEGPIGYIKGEPVFQRSSVYTLHSRETWLKEAKSVRVGEEAYKIVKARPKWDRNTCQIIKDRPLEVFGEWQVEDYEPPLASGGKVPRNEYGNVELFKPRMLPRGCVHLQMPGLNRIARKLNIDCASAMVGFDIHSGWTHPVFDGFVVCEEFKDILLDAWKEDQAEQVKRAEEKRQKRVYDNWKKLIHGMMVKERVRQTYGNALPPKDKDDQAKIKIPDEKECQSKGKIQIKGEHKNTKVTQKDIDDARPPCVTHKVNNLNIDLTSNVVDMAKESRARTMKGNHSVNAKAKREKRKKNKSPQLLPAMEGNIEDSSDETDEEEKREKIRAVLQWGSKDVPTNPNLSDDSDIEGDSRPSCSNFSSLNYIMHANKSFHSNEQKKKKSKRKSENYAKFENHDESSSSATSYSTTPEPNADDITDLKPRRFSRRTTKKMYAESDDNEADISIDESDVEDKSYNPLKEREKTTLNLSESD